MHERDAREPLGGHTFRRSRRSRNVNSLVAHMRPPRPRQRRRARVGTTAVDVCVCVCVKYLFNLNTFSSLNVHISHRAAEILIDIAASMSRGATPSFNIAWLFNIASRLSHSQPTSLCRCGRRRRRIAACNRFSSDPESIRCVAIAQAHIFTRQRGCGALHQSGCYATAAADVDDDVDVPSDTQSVAADGSRHQQLAER